MSIRLWYRIVLQLTPEFIFPKSQKFMRWRSGSKVSQPTSTYLLTSAQARFIGTSATTLAIPTTEISSEVGSDAEAAASRAGRRTDLRPAPTSSSVIATIVLTKLFSRGGPFRTSTFGPTPYFTGGWKFRDLCKKRPGIFQFFYPRLNRI